MIIEPRDCRLPKPSASRGDPYSFGKVFTDHMLSIDYCAEKGGWGVPKIQAYQDIPVAITASSLHYAISCYEGITVVENAKTGIPQAFRMEDNLNSFLASNDHIDMPLFDTKELGECIKELVSQDQEWFPKLAGKDSQLYVRVNHVSTDPLLGVKSPKQTKLYAIICPTTYKTKSLKVKCAHDVYKNWPLGHGQFRISGNLGALVPPIMDAKNNGFDDVLWLLDDYIKEMTVINVFALIKSRYGFLELVTPPNDGCIFNGTIRQSIIDLKDEIQKEKNVQLVEKQLSIQELIHANSEERLVEFFGGATSSSIQSISRISFKDETIDLSENPTAFANYLRTKLHDIMVGPETHKWITSFKK